MTQVPISEVFDALLTDDEILRGAMALRVKAHGIAPPDGCVIVPAVERNQLIDNAEMWRKVAANNGKRIGELEAMLAAAPKQEVKP